MDISENLKRQNKREDDFQKEREGEVRTAKLQDARRAILAAFKENDPSGYAEHITRVTVK